MKSNIPHLALIVAGLFLAAPLISAQEFRSPKMEGKGPLKVFILAGQSNMQGQGTVSKPDAAGNEAKGTLLGMIKDKAKAPLVKHLMNAKGEWAERDDVWVYDINEFGITKGPLQLGYGWELWNTNIFGPELQFGHLVGNYFTHQVLIIKTAWGGKSLKTDYRPPSSGGKLGPYYTLMIETITRVLADIKKEFPDYDGGNYELVGFGWWHGWNDGCETGAIAEYEQNLSNFIKDLRKDLKAPRLPILLAEFTGMSGQNQDPHWSGLSKAQSATAQHPEFKGTVKFVPTRDFQRDEKDSPGGGGHHEWNNAETYFLVGNAMGEGMLKLLSEQSTALTGPGPYVKLATLAKQIQAGQNLGSAVKILTDKKDSKDAAEAAEAVAMLTALTTSAQEQLEDALRSKENDPAEAISKLDNVAKRFAGSEFGTQAKQAAEALKKDPKVKKEIQATTMLEPLLTLESTLKPIPNAHDLKSEAFRRQNSATLHSVMSGCQALIKRYPDTRAARKALEIQDKYR